MQRRADSGGGSVGHLVSVVPAFDEEVRDLVIGQGPLRFS
jgi:hypothetical protein